MSKQEIRPTGAEVIPTPANIQQAQQLGKTHPLLTSFLAGSIPENTRALLVTLNEAGQVGVSEVQFGDSVLNIRTELRKHLNECPFSDDWLRDLRDFINRKLEARTHAARCGGVAIPSTSGDAFSVFNTPPTQWATDGCAGEMA